MKTKIKLFLYLSNDFPEVYVSGEPYEQSFRPHIKTYFSENNVDLIFIREMEIEVETDPDFDPVPHQVSALEAQKLKVLSLYQKSVAEINDQLHKLQSLPER